MCARARMQVRAAARAHRVPATSGCSAWPAASVQAVECAGGTGCSRGARPIPRLFIQVLAHAPTTQVPFVFKYTVDALAADPSGATPAALLGGALVLTPAALLVGYGAARASSTLCNELRNAVFAKVTQGQCACVQRRQRAGIGKVAHSITQALSEA